MSDEVPFVIADRFPGVSPLEVEEWPVEMVEDAMMRIELESAHRKREAKQRGHHAR